MITFNHNCDTVHREVNVNTMCCKGICWFKNLNDASVPDKAQDYTDEKSNLKNWKK